MTASAWLRRIAAVIGVIAPIVLVIYILGQHGMVDFVRDYAPLRRNMYFLISASAASIIAIAADIFFRLSGKRAARIVVALTWIIAGVVILLTAGFTAYILIPKYTGSGDTPPQLVLTGSAKAKGSPGLAVVFYTSRATQNTLIWGETDGHLKSVRENEAVNRHWIKLAGLKPDTEYIYAVNDGKPVTFRTPPGAGQPLWFAAGGDVHIGNQTSKPAETKALLKEIAKPSNGYDALFVLGDFTQLGFENKYWVKAADIFSACTRSIPMAVVLGNHDTMLGGIDLYRQYETPPAGGSNSPLWRRIDIGNVHFLLLDLEWELQMYTPAQEIWLKAQLKSIPKDDWTIVMCHTFFYSSGAVEDGWPWYDNKSVIDKLCPLFEENDVDIVISGHKHDNELLQKNGITYVVSGAFGGEPDRLLEYKSPASVWLAEGKYAFADVTINGNLATIAFREKTGKSLYTKTIKR